jgi:putative ABC transport system permease protein
VGGIGGVALGWAVTGVYANVKGWSVLIPPIAIGGGMAAALLIGAIAGLYPAVRAARMSPTEALRSA